MESIVRESRMSIHFGINYIIAGSWAIEKKQCVDFEIALLDKQLEFGQTQMLAREFSLRRTDQSPLLVKITRVGPQVSGVSISSEQPQHQLEFFAKEAEAICQAWRQVWAANRVQILECRAGIRHLYSCRDHAFKYLWENRLGQTAEDFHSLGRRPVLGGGLRLIMPPNREDAEPAQIEIKIESFLQDSKKLFVESAFVWPKPRLLPADKDFDPDFRLQCVEKYATNQVWNFIENPQPGI